MLTLNIYLQDYDISNEWVGQWFEISSVEDIQAAIKVCRDNGVEEILVADLEEYEFTYSQLGGEGMLYFLEKNIDILSEIYDNCSIKPLLEYYLENYKLGEVIDKINTTDITEIIKEENLTIEELVGYYYYDLLDTTDVPEPFKSYFDYDSYGRDLLLNGSSTILEDDNYIYLIN